jgi:predicted enzyme related to lactoylglutathione lyase
MSSVARYEEDEFDEVMMAFDGPQSSATIMLVERPSHQGPYAIGDGFDRILIMVDDIHDVLESVVRCGGSVERHPVGRPEHGVTIAIVRGLDGYRIELLQQL